MSQRPVCIGDGKVSPAQKPDPLTKIDGHPAPEEHLGGGDICSPEQPSTDDDVPLD